MLNLINLNIDEFNYCLKLLTSNFDSINQNIKKDITIADLVHTSI